MSNSNRGSIRSAAAAAALAVFMVSAAACGSGDSPAVSPNKTVDTSNGSAAAANVNAQRPNPYTTPSADMADHVEGKVISLLCYKNNPSTPPEASVDCAKEATQKGGWLGVLAADGTIYISDAEKKTNNQTLEPFIGESVTLQGTSSSEPATDLEWTGAKVVKFHVRMCRRNGPPAPGTPKNAPTTNGPAPAAPPKKS